MHAFLILLTAALQTQPSTAPASSDVAGGPSNVLSLQSVLHLLSNPQPSSRTRVPEELKGGSPALIAGWLDDAHRLPRSPEESYRLAEIVQHLAVKAANPAPSGATVDVMGFLGIRMGQVPVVTAGPQVQSVTSLVYVAETIPGFGGSKSLRMGDIVTGINDTALPSGQFAFQQVISNIAVGSIVRLSILRNGTALQVNVTVSPRPGGPALDPGQGMLFRQAADAWDLWQRDFESVPPGG